ncbi:hypothetical protein L1887_18098 [Cichorium endivia]|nr:hypothetical protein L1887_18098 [Cichorium endivia]
MEIEELKQALTTEINKIKEATVYIHNEMLEKSHSCNCWWKWLVVVMLSVAVKKFARGTSWWYNRSSANVG